MNIARLGAGRDRKRLIHKVRDNQCACTSTAAGNHRIQQQCFNIHLRILDRLCESEHYPETEFAMHR